MESCLNLLSNLTLSTNFSSKVELHIPILDQGEYEDNTDEYSDQRLWSQYQGSRNLLMKRERDAVIFENSERGEES